jgi:signal recognition particle receptor subunit beta
MAVYNYAGGEVNIKIVYYGPGLSGKTTNLEYMYSKLPRENKGKMVSMKTRTDRTLFFDFLPIEVGELNGLKVRFLLYTVPGQVYYNATRKLVLKGVDALVFVADSSPDRMDDNRESLSNLEENLNEIGMSLADTPWVMQFNKRDVPGCMDTAQLEAELNDVWKTATFEAVATEGKGVYETFEGIAKLVFKQLRRELKSRDGAGAGSEDEPGVSAVDVEVVAQGDSRAINSEAGESETSGYAEEREEEHESVSEFVDNVLSEDSDEQAEDLGMEREGYEEYGHMVELGGNGEKSAAAGEEAGTSVAVEEAAVEETAEEPAEEAEEFINDPLVKFAKNKEGEPEAAQESAAAEEPVSAAEESDDRPSKMVTVPIELTEEEIRNEVPVKVILDIKVHSGV